MAGLCTLEQSEPRSRAICASARPIRNAAERRSDLNPSLLDEKVRSDSDAKSESPRENNRTRIEDRAAHEWYRFVLSFPPHLVRDYANKFALNETSCVLDPFCGTGTTVVECKRLGIPSVGIERNPMAWFASTTKTDWSISPDALWRHAKRVAEVVNDRLDRQGLGEYRVLFSRRPSLKPN